MDQHPITITLRHKTIVDQVPKVADHLGQWVHVGVAHGGPSDGVDQTWFAHAGELVKFEPECTYRPLPRVPPLVDSLACFLRLGPGLRGEWEIVLIGCIDSIRRIGGRRCAR